MYLYLCFCSLAQPSQDCQPTMATPRTWGERSNFKTMWPGTFCFYSLWRHSIKNINNSSAMRRNLCSRLMIEDKQFRWALEDSLTKPSTNLNWSADVNGVLQNTSINRKSSKCFKFLEARANSCFISLMLHPPSLYLCIGDLSFWLNLVNETWC